MSFEPTQGARLLRLARESVAEALGGRRAEPLREAWANEPAATFVTLRHADGELQGCIGSLEPRRSLAADVASNAVSAALHDPRASHIALRDVARLSVEISILGPMSRIEGKDEAAILAALRPGIDGVVVRWRSTRGTLLPQVWESLPDPREFLAHVKLKAHLPPDFWAPDIEVLRYGMQKFSDPPEDDARPAAHS